MCARHAVIIGSGMAGLVAARVLAGFFDQVTVVERDILPDRPEFRPGVPHARHVHVLLLRGQAILEKLSPGLQQDLARAGAEEMDWTDDVRSHGFGKWVPRFKSGALTRVATRDLIEYTLRNRLHYYPHVKFQSESQVVGLVADSASVAGKRVTSIMFQPRGVPAGTNELAADLVVDASGRESKLPEWMRECGFPEPHETVVNSFLGYASRLYARPPGVQDWKALFIRGVPPYSSRGGIIFPVEGNRWIANFGAAQRDYPPTDDDGFLDFARGLPDPAMYDILKDAAPLGPVYGYRRTDNHWRRYERLERVPENLVALGDAVCAFNPVYGQGMTVAAMGAELLGECIRAQSSDFTGLAKRFYKKLAKMNATPWALATSVDFLYPGTESNEPHKSNPLWMPIRYRSRKSRSRIREFNSHS